MENQILVTYATRAGSTEEIAQVIGDALQKRGFSVDIKDINTKPALEKYQAAIIGSAIRFGNWLPEALQYLQNNLEELRRMPVYFFSVHLLNRDNSQDSLAARRTYSLNAKDLLTPQNETFLSGKMDYLYLPFFDRILFKNNNHNDIYVEGDFRDWDQIRAWSDHIQLEINRVL